MEFEEVYKNYNKIIHYLLNHYHITYNYDEFYQLLLIKMWQLTLNYDEQKSPR
ncbi:RNA polymerase sigma factor SigS (fragment) [Staphylococcus capitis]